MSTEKVGIVNELQLIKWKSELASTGAVALFAVGVIPSGPRKGFALLTPDDLTRADVVEALERIVESLKGDGP